MSDTATIPVFDPQGILRDVPEDQLQAAVKNGGTPAVRFQAPDKSIRFVPANRTKEALSSGGKLLPFEQQDVKHPGFWANIHDDVVGLPGKVYDTLTADDPLADPRVSDEEKNRIVAEQEAASAATNERRTAEHGAPYSYAASAGEMAGVNVPGMEKSAEEGDIGGVLGHAAAVPAIMAATGAAGGALDEASLARVGRIWNAWRNLRNFTDPGAPLPEKPPAEFFQARGLAKGGAAPQPEPAAALGGIPNRYVRPTPDLPEAFQPYRPTMRPPIGTADNPFQGPGAAGSLAQSVAAPESLSEVGGQPIERTTPPPNIENAPRTLSGEGVLGQVLDGRDQATLLKIARSRGINVAQEAQLKPGVANKRIIAKIVDDFSPEELDEVRAQSIENRRFEHAFGDIGKEAWSTMALQTYFPDVKIPMAQLLRTQKAIQSASAPKFAPLAASGAEDLTQILKDSLKAAQGKKTAGAAGSMTESVAQ